MKTKPYIQYMQLTAFILVAAITLAITFSVSNQYLAVKKQETLSNAVDGCMKASLYRNMTTKTDGSVITTEDVIAPSVQKCLQLKKISE